MMEAAMELVYQSDAYCRVLDTKVKVVQTLELPSKTDDSGGGVQCAVQFASTIIYPGGGGQHPDSGRVQILGGPAAAGTSLPVLDVFKDRNELWYLTEGTALLPGTPVRLTIDWDRRYALMRTHTAMHILIGVIWRDYRKLVTGSNLDLLKARLDFEFEGLGPSLLDEIEKRANLEVAAARPVQVTFAQPDSSVEGLIRTKTNLVPEGIARLRFVDIVGLDKQADGGTHVRSTAEVGSIHITGFDNKGKINKRIRMELDQASAPD